MFDSYEDALKLINEIEYKDYSLTDEDRLLFNGLIETEIDELIHD